MKTNLNKDGKAQSDGKPSTESTSKPQVNKSIYHIVFSSFLTGLSVAVFMSASCQRGEHYRELNFLTFSNFANMSKASKHIYIVVFLNKDDYFVSFHMFVVHILVACFYYPPTFHIEYLPIMYLPFHFKL